MALEPKVKAYDIRGMYPGELDEEGAYAIGRAYVEQFEPATIAVGRDMRLSSPTMQEAFVRGAAEAGVDVLDIGMIGTEMLYYAVGELGLDGGATITASHNPKDYTGAKIVRRGRCPSAPTPACSTSATAPCPWRTCRGSDPWRSRRATSTRASSTRSCPSSTRAR